MGNNCLDCGKEISRKSLRCLSCAKKGNRNPWFGKKRSEETIRKMREAHRGENHPQWKGGRIIDDKGYVRLWRPNHPSATKNRRYIPEHRLVMEEFLGRYLEPGEIVHHINGIRDDNRLENLQLFTSRSKHLTHRWVGEAEAQKWQRAFYQLVGRWLQQRRIMMQGRKT